MKLYDNDGWISWNNIININEPFTFGYGGRGCGKTYGLLKTIFTNPDKPKFVFMRRTQKQLNTISVEGLSPFIKLRNDLGLELKIKANSKTETTSILIDGEERGVGISLSTVSNLRGFDSEADYFIYDEFIPDPNERKTIKMEGFAFMNVVETLARNRELLGKPPLKVFGLANANDIGNPIFMELGLVTVAERMKEKEKEFYHNHDRGLLLLDFFKSPISEMKKDTSLYKVADKNSSFYNMAIGNEFVDDSIAIIKSRNLKEYTPLVTISELTFYEHKSEDLYYLSEHRSGSPPIYSTASADLEKFRKEYYYLWNAYLDRCIEFENRLCSVVFDKLW